MIRIGCFVPVDRIEYNCSAAKNLNVVLDSFWQAVAAIETFSVAVCLSSLKQTAILFNSS